VMRRAPAVLAWLVLLVCASGIAVGHALQSSVETTPLDSWLLSCSFLAFPAIGALIVSRRPGNTVGWIFCAVGLGTAATSFSAGYVHHALAMHADTQVATGLIDLMGNTVWPLNIGLGSLLLFLFPDGRLPSWRWRFVFWLDVAAIAASSLSTIVHPGPMEQVNGKGLVLNPLGIAGAGPLLDAVNNLAQSVFAWLALVAVISVIVRYRHAAGAQRQQIKWFAYGATLLVVFILGGLALAQVVTPSGQDPSNNIIANMGFVLGFVMLPVGAGIGVLRYRLYDIDIIINRTLVYGSLTLILAAVYFGGVVGVQAVVQALTGTRTLPAYVIVASTLLIAALFTPLRRRLQSGIDRRFYRRKYDTARTLAAFGAALRQDIDIAELREHLLGVVAETMQPARVSLWLRPPEQPQEIAVGRVQRGGRQTEGGGI
jgi:hypothetical protein